MEIGPIRINADGTPRLVENTAWNEYANVLFRPSHAPPATSPRRARITDLPRSLSAVDQPAGTGFSYVTKNDNVRELSQAAESVVVFLMHLYELFPDLQQMDTYIAGESYAGQYIPYIADAISSSAWISTPLKGLVIGNGWISPKEQYPAYLTCQSCATPPPFAVNLQLTQGWSVIQMSSRRAWSRAGAPGTATYKKQSTRARSR